MEHYDLKRRDFPPARFNAAPDEGDLLALEKSAALTDEPEILKKRDDIVRRAKDYSDANEGDLEED